MSKYRKNLPQIDGKLFLTDGGLETTLIFHDGMDLPYFAAFDLLKDDAGIDMLRRYFERYIEIARQWNLGFVLEAPTWRANPDWAARLNYSTETLADANRKAIGLLLEIRTAHETHDSPMVISGNLGPRGDGYRVDTRMSIDEARVYHSPQVETFAQTDADMISAFTINYVEEAIGIVQAAREADMPVVISFTVETDGHLPDGAELSEAIVRTDQATDGYPAYYMINCAHPTHFKQILRQGGSWTGRVHGLRANASKRSHTELDDSQDLDTGNPRELGNEYRALRELLPNLMILGGCCGTDHHHIGQIAAGCHPGA